MGTISQLLSQGITLKNLGHTLAAKSNGFLAAYDLCENVEEVKSSLEDIEQKTLLTLYKNGLGIDTKTLSAEARTFLGLK